MPHAPMRTRGNQTVEKSFPDRTPADESYSAGLIRSLCLTPILLPILLLPAETSRTPNESHTLNFEPGTLNPCNGWNGWNQFFYPKLAAGSRARPKIQRASADKNHALTLTIAGETDENPKYQNTRLDHNALVFKYLASITDSSVSACLLPSALLIVTTIGTTIFGVHQVVFSPAAVRQFKRLPAAARSLLKEAIREQLAEHDPTEETRNRFRLRRISEFADYELRVDPWRVFYRVQHEVVTIELIGQKKGNVLLIGGKEFKL
jgi:mRNA-degrading endonuclease RelE of RelBE toxin-antitoxin system